MIDIKIRGNSLDLLPSTSIRIEVESPIFDLEAIPTTYSYPFTVPATDRNRRLLGYVSELALAGAGTRRFDAEVWLDGIRWKSGSLVIDKSSQDGISCYLAMDSGAIAHAVEGVLLNQLDLGGPIVMGNHITWPVTMEDYARLDPWPESPWTFFPVRNLNATGGDSDLDCGNGGAAGFDGTGMICPVINYWTSLNGVNFYFYNHWFNAGFTSWPWNVMWSSGHVYLSLVLEKSFGLGGYIPAGDWFQDPDIRKLVIHSMRVAAHKYISTTDLSLDPAEGLPAVSVADLLVQIRKLFCLGYFFDPQGAVVRIIPLRDVIRSPEFDEWSVMTLAGYEVSDSDTSAISLQFELDGSDEMMAEVQDWRGSSELPAVGDPVMLPLGDAPGTIRRAESEFRVWRKANATQWAAAGPALHPYGPQGAPTVHQVSITPTAMWRGEDRIPYDFSWGLVPPSRTWKIPEVRQQCSYDIGTDQGAVNPTTHQEDFGLRLLFYHGFRQDSSGNTYPFGSSDNYDSNGTRIGEYSLGWHGPDGLAEVWWQEYLALIQNGRKVRRQVLITLAELIELDIARRKHIHGQMYWIVSMSITITMNGIEPADVVLLREVAP